jgi:hypothetical protein
MQQDDGGSDEMDGGEKRGSTEPKVFITGEVPNPQSKNRVSYNYRTPTLPTSYGKEYQQM